MAAIIELTDNQIRALAEPQSDPPQLVNPHTKESFVLLRVDQYKKLTDEPYDDSPWTREELEASAWQSVDGANGNGEADDAAEVG